jgi:hypothetical protein
MATKCKISIFLPGGRGAEIRQIPVPEGYKAIKAALAPIIGTKIEHVTVLHDGNRHDMFVSEDGHVQCLPRNELATTVYRNAHMTQRAVPGEDPKGLPWIAGPAVLFHNVIVWR